MVQILFVYTKLTIVLQRLVLFLNVEYLIQKLKIRNGSSVAMCSHSWHRKGFSEVSYPLCLAIIHCFVNKKEMLKWTNFNQNKNLISYYLVVLLCTHTDKGSFNIYYRYR